MSDTDRPFWGIIIFLLIISVIFGIGSALIGWNLASFFGFAVG